MTEKKRLIYIHIGHGKTGTTAVQDMFWLNRVEFLKHGILYPQTGVSYGTQELLQSAHHLLCNNLSVSYDEHQQQSLRNTLKLLRAEIEASAAKKAFISSEMLCYADPDVPSLLKETFFDYAVRVIYVVRRQDYLIPSAYIQAAKEGRLDANCTLEDYAELYGYAFHFKERIDPWRRAFGSQSIDCRLIREENRQDIRNEILELISCKVHLATVSGGRTNNSLDIRFLDFFKAIDSMGLTADQRWGVIEALESVPGINNYSRSQSDELLNLCRTRFTQGNLEFAREFLDNEQAKYICFDLA